MTVATALIAGNDAVPQLAEQAVRTALKRAGNPHANSVLLLLSSAFTRHAQSAVLAAGRAAQCTQVFGGIGAGVSTEADCAVDRPAAAAMVFCGDVSLSSGEHREGTGGSPLLCCTNAPFPPEWRQGQRFGSHFHDNASDGAVWQQGRVITQGFAEAQIVGARLCLAVSSGVRTIGTPLPVDEVRGYDLLSLGGQPALDTLLRLLPADWKTRTPLPLHLINAMLGGDDATRTAGVISANADRSLTMAVPLQPGQMLGWAIREPLSSEADMRASLDSLETLRPLRPDFGMAFSCIGRGPLFYGGEDRDWSALLERYPDVPFIGAYGTGQIVCHGDSSRQLQNSFVTALFNEDSEDSQYSQYSQDSKDSDV